MKSLRNTVAVLLMTCPVFQASAQPLPTQGKPAAAADDPLSYATCPIVYPVDQSPSERGYHYIFYGNGFFINNEGYLLTAAHVLSQLNDAQPYILLRLPMAPPRLLPVTLVAMDRDHDVALLRATPNPFAGKYQVRFLPLLVKPPALSRAVEASALRPSRLKDPHSFDYFSEDRPSGEVLGYQFNSNDKGNDTELFLFSHDVLLGDSGAPVVAADSQAVVGLVEGRWLRPTPAPFSDPRKLANGIGAAVPIHYAIALLQQQGIAWHSYAANETNPAAATLPSNDSATPVPLSLIAPPYPSQALLGGEVVLDALVNRQGQLADIKVVRGGPPFVDKALSAVRTWSFLPARQNGQAVETRIGIAFQFTANVGAMREKSSQSSADDSHGFSSDVQERGPLPSVMVEPQSPPISGSDANVILSAQIDAQGHAASIQVLRGEESLGPSATAAVSQWQFTSAKHAGENCASTFIAVEIVRGGAVPTHTKSASAAHSLVQ